MKTILGLGSNVGDRLSHLRRAIQSLAHAPISPARLRIIALSPIYESNALLPAAAPTDWDQPYLNINVLCETSYEPLQLLTYLKNIETQLGRQNKGKWGPREIDIDILAMDDIVFKNESLEIPHPGLCERLFALLPFADLWPQWQYPVPGPYYEKSAKELTTRALTADCSSIQAHRAEHTYTALMGILNLTPDSFSDGNSYTSLESIVQKAKNWIDRGVTVLDLGAESTRPGAIPLNPEDEWRRLEPVLNTLIAYLPDWPSSVRLCIDTRHPQVATKALNAGAHWINDVSGFQDDSMKKIAAESSADIVMMHSLSVPANRTLHLPLNCDPVEELLQWGNYRIQELEAQGIRRERILFDPGIGFGKTYQQTLKILKEIRRFRELGVRILVGHSRKSFFSHITDAPAAERDLETLTFSINLIEKGVDILRVHNIDSHLRCGKAWTQINGLCHWL